MPRPAIPRLAAPRSARLLIAAWAALSSGPAMAQMAGSFNDPLTPYLNADQRKPPAFHQVDARTLAQANRPTSFTPLPSGAGLTGFDASNAPQRALPRNPSTVRLAEAALVSGAGTTGFDAGNSPRRATSPAATPGATPLALDTLAAATPPSAPSPYQTPIPPLAGTAPAAAAPPGTLALSRRPPKKRKAHPDEPTDPYEAAGIRAGAFLLYPALELSGGYNSNPDATPDGKGAVIYKVAPELRVQSDWSRHQLKADLRGSYTGYSPDETPTLSRPNFTGKVDGRIDVRRNTHVLLSSNVLISTDNPGSPNLQAGLSKLPVFITYGGSAGFDHTFSRFTLTLKGNTERTSYQHSTLTDGTIVSNTDRNFDQFGATLRGSYETMPGVKPFIEVEVDKRVHDTELDDYGYARNSKGVTGRVGSTFTLRRRLTGEISVGYARRTYEDARLAPLRGLIGDASLVWTADALNTVKLDASSTLGESTIAGVSGVLSRNVSVELDHSFRRWLIGSVKLGLGWDSYKGTTVGGAGTAALCSCVVTTPGGTSADRVDKHYSLGLGLTYKIDRTVQIKGEFSQDWLRSNVSGVDYTASTVMLGLRFQR